MARKNSDEEDVHQSSLDAFVNGPSDSNNQKNSEPVIDSSNVPAMPDLDNLAKAESEPQSQDTIAQPDVESKPLRSFEMPSARGEVAKTTPNTKLIFHDMEKLYPNPPIKDGTNGLVIHRAVLHDLTGVGQLLDWLSDDHGAIVDMNRLMKREVEFAIAIDRLNQFVESDLGGQIIQITDSRLMLLPPGCRGLKGVDNEAFAAEADDLGQRRF